MTGAAIRHFGPERVVLLAEEKRKRPPMGEVGVIPSSLGGLSIMPYNPDRLVGMKGLRVYQEMTREPYIKAALIQKKSNLLSVPWDVTPATEDPRDAEIARFVKWNLGTHIRGIDQLSQAPERPAVQLPHGADRGSSQLALDLRPARLLHRDHAAPLEARADREPAGVVGGQERRLH